MFILIECIVPFLPSKELLRFFLFFFFAGSDLSYHKLQPRTIHYKQTPSNSLDRQPLVSVHCSKWRNVREMGIEFVGLLMACQQHFVFHGSKDGRRPLKLYLKHTRKTLPSEMWMSLVLLKNIGNRRLQSSPWWGITLMRHFMRPPLSYFTKIIFNGLGYSWIL